MPATDALFGMLAVASTALLQCQALYVTMATRGDRHPPVFCSAAILSTSVLWIVYACLVGAWFLVAAAGVTVAQQGVILSYAVVAGSGPRWRCGSGRSTSPRRSRSERPAGGDDSPPPVAVVAPCQEA
tara:strand:+ start:1078 stop:1461 length:384 start_codon:yes stop_codon:yes gene_type:complete